MMAACLQHTAISRKSPTEPHTDAFRRSAPAGPPVPGARSQQPAAPHHKRRSSLLSDLAEDFSISLSDTRRQVQFLSVGQLARSTCWVSAVPRHCFRQRSSLPCCTTFSSTARMEAARQD
jgi:hypothetical protein